MGTPQGCCVLFWTNPESSTPQNSNCMTTYLLSHKPSKKKTSKTCWRSKDKLISDILLWTLTHGHTNVGCQVKTRIHQLDTGCHIVNLSRRIIDREGWWERVQGICAINMFWWWLNNTFQYFTFSTIFQSWSWGWGRKVVGDSGFQELNNSWVCWYVVKQINKKKRKWLKNKNKSKYDYINNKKSIYAFFL